MFLYKSILYICFHIKLFYIFFFYINICIVYSIKFTFLRLHFLEFVELFFFFYDSFMKGQHLMKIYKRVIQTNNKQYKNCRSSSWNGVWAFQLCFGHLLTGKNEKPKKQFQIYLILFCWLYFFPSCPPYIYALCSSEVEENGSRQVAPWFFNFVAIQFIGLVIFRILQYLLW